MKRVRMKNNGAYVLALTNHSVLRYLNNTDLQTTTYIVSDNALYKKVVWLWKTNERPHL